MNNGEQYNTAQVYIGTSNETSYRNGWARSPYATYSVLHVLSIIGVVVLTLMSFVAGLNAFLGVHFLYEWVFGFSITYLISSVVIYLIVLVWVLASRSENTNNRLIKPWQVQQTQNSLLIVLFVAVTMTAIPLCIYGFTLGDGNPCPNPLACDVEATVSGTYIWGLFWVAGFLYFTALADMGLAQSQSRYDIQLLSPDEASQFVKLSGNKNINANGNY